MALKREWAWAEAFTRLEWVPLLQPILFMQVFTDMLPIHSYHPSQFSTQKCQ